MTMIDALGRVEQIQSRLQQLSGLAVRSSAGTAVAASAAATTSSEGFAATLAAALGTTPTAPVAATPVAATSGTGRTGDDIVTAAKKYIGVPYVFGGEDASGMDCSGLVQRVYADAGITVPRLVSGQMTQGTEVASLAEARPGDLIVTGGGAHILIYAGNNKVIHAPYPGRTVCLVDAYMKESDITTIRRIVPAPGASSAAAGAVAGSTADMFSAALASFAAGASA